MKNGGDTYTKLTSKLVTRLMNVDYTFSTGDVPKSDIRGRTAVAFAMLRDHIKGLTDTKTVAIFALIGSLFGTVVFRLVSEEMFFMAGVVFLLGAVFVQVSFSLLLSNVQLLYLRYAATMDCIAEDAMQEMSNDDIHLEISKIINKIEEASGGSQDG